MKMHHTAVCGQHVPPVSEQVNRCLPFCGLGAAETLRNKAARCGAILLEQSPLRSGELAEAQTKA